jgi:hypothetical protein
MLQRALYFEFATVSKLNPAKFCGPNLSTSADLLQFDIQSRHSPFASVLLSLPLGLAALRLIADF